MHCLSGTCWAPNICYDKEKHHSEGGRMPLGLQFPDSHLGSYYLPCCSWTVPHCCLGGGGAGAEGNHTTVSANFLGWCCSTNPFHLSELDGPSTAVCMAEVVSNRTQCDEWVPINPKLPPSSQVRNCRSHSSNRGSECSTFPMGEKKLGTAPQAQTKGWVIQPLMEYVKPTNRLHGDPF